MQPKIHLNIPIITLINSRPQSVIRAQQLQIAQIQQLIDITVINKTNIKNI